MSEKIYAWLLRLFPSRFREAYGEEALQLVRDRCRDEKGFLLRLRLWLDLLGDLALSVPRAYFRVQPELTSYAAHLRSEGVPSLLILPDESLGAGTLLRSEEHTSELQSRLHLVCRLLLEKKKNYSLTHRTARLRRTSALRAAPGGACTRRCPTTCACPCVMAAVSSLRCLHAYEPDTLS